MDGVQILTMQFMHAVVDPDMCEMVEFASVNAIAVNTKNILYIF